jgi:hypothetical protein
MLSTRWQGYRRIAWVEQGLLGLAVVVVIAQGQWQQALTLALFLVASLVFVVRDDKSPTSGKAGGLKRGTAQSGLTSTIHLITATVQSVGLPSPVPECIYEPFPHLVPPSKHHTLVPKSAAPQSSSVSPHSFALSLSHFYP